jgi:hypothetical protein
MWCHERDRVAKILGLGDYQFPNPNLSGHKSDEIFLAHTY